MVPATRMRPSYVRLPVSSADLNQIVKVHGNVLAALADQGAFFGEVYPAISTDDGGSWVIDGPQFNGGGASGPSVTDRLSVSSDQTLIAWGRGGNAIKTRARAERHWQAADVGEVRRVRVVGRRLVAQLLDQRANGREVPGEAYVSRDDGRTWQLR